MEQDSFIAYSDDLIKIWVSPSSGKIQIEQLVCEDRTANISIKQNGWKFDIDQWQVLKS